MKLVVLALLLAVPVFGAGPYGADNGWAIANDGTPLLTPSAAAAMVVGGTGWVRIEMRLIPGHSTWDDQI